MMPLFRVFPVVALALSITACTADKAENLDDSAAHPVDADGDGFAADRDCDDDNASVNTDAVEACNGIDDDCDGSTDEEGATGSAIYHADADLDGYGDPAVSAEACAASDGWVDDETDCDDANADIHPGVSDDCDQIDNDCDEAIDEDATELSTWYEDSDADTYGHPTNTVEACMQPDGYVDNGDDCDDGDAARSPDAAELCDEEDNDCDGATDEEPTDGTTWYQDNDGDRYGDDTISTVACDKPTGYSPTGGDCDDSDSKLSPAVVEVCDEVDNNCDGVVDNDARDAETWYTDTDGDGYGAVGTEEADCTPDATDVLDGGDCDDGDADINPGNEEACDDTNGVDDDCDGVVDDGALSAPVWYTDSDGDGYGDETSGYSACTGLSGEIETGGDCDDADADINPGVEEDCTVTDGVDNDCDGTTDAPCAYNEGQARFQYGMDVDPDYRGCDLYWDTTWTITTSTCAECEWTADVDFTYDASISDNTEGCVDTSAADWTWSFGYDSDLYGYGFGAMWYWYDTYWTPVWRAEWDTTDYELTFYGGTYEYRYGREYYTRYWSGYATVYPY